MPTNPTHVHMAVTGDSRLVGAVTGAVEHFAQGAGLDEATQKQLMSAAEQAYRETLSQLETEGTLIEVLIEHYPDRLEVLFAHSSSSVPAIGLDSFLGIEGNSSPGHGVMLLSLVDRVLYDTQGGKSQLRLVKYLASGSQKVQ